MRRWGKPRIITGVLWGKEFGSSKLSTEIAWVTYLVRLGWESAIFLIQFDLSAVFSATVLRVRIGSLCYNHSPLLGDRFQLVLVVRERLSPQLLLYKVS